MFNVGAGEMVFILVAALIILGPKRLPEMARGIGKFLREFRRQTDDVRQVVEREFYAMDQEVIPSLDTPLDPAPKLEPAPGILARANALPETPKPDVAAGASPTPPTNPVPRAPVPSSPPRTFSSPSSPAVAYPARPLDPSVARTQEIDPLAPSSLPDDAGHGKAD